MIDIDDASLFVIVAVAALVGAAILSTLVFPLVGLHLRRGRAEGYLKTLPSTAQAAPA